MSDRTAALIGRWQVAEERLYPIVMVRPEAYERYLRLVRVIADELRDVRTIDELADAFDRAAGFAGRAVERVGLATHDLDLDLAAEAAFGLRYREVARETARAEALRRIEDARERGDPWVVVIEHGVPGTVLYRRLEMHEPTGRGMELSVEAEADTGDVRYVIQALRLDPRTGDRLVVEGEPPVRTTAATVEEWEREAVELRARLESDPV